jgi:RNA-splicing ligase RtcB
MLELGAGVGLVACTAAQLNADVIATDVGESVLENLWRNAQQNILSCAGEVRIRRLDWTDADHRLISQVDSTCEPGLAEKRELARDECEPERAEHVSPVASTAACAREKSAATNGAGGEPAQKRRKSQESVIDPFAWSDSDVRDTLERCQLILAADGTLPHWIMGLLHSLSQPHPL